MNNDPNTPFRVTIDMYKMELSMLCSVQGASSQLERGRGDRRKKIESSLELVTYAISAMQANDLGYISPVTTSPFKLQS